MTEAERIGEPPYLELTQETEWVLAAVAEANDRTMAYVAQEVLHKWALHEIKMYEVIMKLAEERETRPRTNKRLQLSKDIRAEVFKRANGICSYCSIALDPFSGWSVDHVTPISKGGGNDPDNLVAACTPCNLRKSAKNVVAFKAERL